MTFKITVHYPNDEKKKTELAKKVSAVHAQTVIEKIKSMSCPMEQKAEMINKIIQIHKNKDGA